MASEAGKGSPMTKRMIVYGARKRINLIKKNHIKMGLITTQMQIASMMFATI